MSLLILRTKPNPLGKDRAGNNPLPAQLNGEWVDIQNNGPAAVTLAGVYLSNQQFAPGCVPSQITTYWEGSSVSYLGPGEIVRVHTGRERDRSLMSGTDLNGAQHHAFAESGNFALNNRCGDSLALWMRGRDGSWAPALDLAAYNPWPAEGAVLNRMGAWLA